MRYGVIQQGDCLELMKKIPDKSIDMILCDLPYGVTSRNKWDSVIPFEVLWENYNRIIKDRGCIALFCDGMFMAQLMTSNKKMWRYNLVWDKVLSTGFLNANKMPMRRHEEIAIFYKKTPVYTSQKVQGSSLNHAKGGKALKSGDRGSFNYGEYSMVDNRESLGEMKHPTSILRFQKPHPSVNVHPTQKPIELLEFLIKSYTSVGELVLDNCMGSGSTCVAAINTGRKYIGIELDGNYYETAEKRVKEAEESYILIKGESI